MARTSARTWWRTVIAFEYTYDGPYLYQDLLRQDETAARTQGLGLWSPTTCNGRPPAATSTTAGTSTSASFPSDAPAGCVIKGNINTKGDKIYHFPGDDSYDETVITESKGERYFCTTQEAEGRRLARRAAVVVVSDLSTDGWRPSGLTGSTQVGRAG